MSYKHVFLVMTSAWLVAGQRPSFAGSRPIGYPEVITPEDSLGNRFGDDTPLPVEAKGDRALVERLSKLPIDQQPFWFINWKAIEAAQKNPQTFPQRESSFTPQLQPGASQPQSNSQSNPSSIQSNSGSNSNGLASKFGETNNPASGNFASNGGKLESNGGNFATNAANSGSIYAKRRNQAFVRSF